MHVVKTLEFAESYSQLTQALIDRHQVELSVVNAAGEVVDWTPVTELNMDFEPARYRIKFLSLSENTPSYCAMVKALAKPGEKIRSSLNGQQVQLILWALNRVVLLGQLVDMVKRMTFYEKTDISLDDIAARFGLPDTIDAGGNGKHHLTAEQCHLMHMLFALPGEVAELAEGMLPFFETGEELDMANVMEELGDAEFYLEGLRQGLGATRTYTLLANQQKLAKRYHKGAFSNEQANQRADKQ